MTRRKKILDYINENTSCSTVVTTDNIADALNMDRSKTRYACEQMRGKFAIGGEGGRWWKIEGGGKFLFMRYQSESLVRCMPCL